jgi:hypothetical protein
MTELVSLPARATQQPVADCLAGRLLAGDLGLAVVLGALVAKVAGSSCAGSLAPGGV